MANPATGSIAPGKDKKIKLKADVKEKVNLNFKLTVMLGTETHFLNVRVRSVTGVFGTDPATLDHVDDEGLRVPTVLALMKRSLIASDGLISEGIFRLAGDVFEIAKLKEDMNKKTFETSDNINTIATLIKVWFRELPEPILNKVPTESIFYSSDADRCIQAYTNLSEPYKSYLTWLLDLLCQTTAHSQVNRMTPQNLAIVVAPNLYDTSSSDPMEGLVMSQKCVQFLNNILLWYLEQKTGSVPTQIAAPAISLKKDGSESSGSLIITPRGTSKSPTKQRRALQRNATEGPGATSTLSRSNDALESPRKSPGNSPRTGVRRNKSIREASGSNSPRGNRPSHPAPPIPTASDLISLTLDDSNSGTPKQTPRTPTSSQSPTPFEASQQTGTGATHVLAPPTPVQERLHDSGAESSVAPVSEPAQPFSESTGPIEPTKSTITEPSHTTHILAPPTPIQDRHVTESASIIDTVPAIPYHNSEASTLEEPSSTFEHAAEDITEPMEAVTDQEAHHFSVADTSLPETSEFSNDALVEGHATNESQDTISPFSQPDSPHLAPFAPSAPVAGSSLPGTPPPTGAPPQTPPLQFGLPPAMPGGSPRLTPRAGAISARSVPSPSTPPAEYEPRDSAALSTPRSGGPIGVPLEVSESPRTPRDESGFYVEPESQPALVTPRTEGYEEDVVEDELDVEHARASLQGIPDFPSPGMTH